MNSNADIPAALASLLSAGPAPDCTLEFINGDLPLCVHALMLQIASPVMHQAVQCEEGKAAGLTIQVEGPRAAWINISLRCYPNAPNTDTLVRPRVGENTISIIPRCSISGHVPSIGRYHSLSPTFHTAVTGAPRGLCHRPWGWGPGLFTCVHRD